VNPLVLAEAEAFRNRVAGRPYQERALDHVVRAEMNFCSTHNSLDLIMRRYVKVACPLCHKEMELRLAGGNSVQSDIGFYCECGVILNFSLPYEAISVKFPEKK
jgi:hypothetical protein